MKKKLLSFVLTAAMVCAALVAPVAKSEDVKAADVVVNYALGKTVIASSIESGEYVAANAVDGNVNTRWSSAFRDAEWIMVDLGEIRTVGSVRMYWEAAYASQYTISWSQDNVTWYDAATRMSNSYSYETSEMFYNRPVRYIKVTMDRRGTVYGSSLYELEVLGMETVPETTTEAPTTAAISNIALNKPATASSIEAGEYDASKAFDGNMNTRWSSAFTDNEWIMVDLGAVSYIESVELQWEAAYALNSDILISNDGVNWTTRPVLKSQGIADRVYIFGQGRYVKVKGNLRATPYGYSLFEIKVWGR